jgi:hypothetical protein
MLGMTRLALVILCFLFRSFAEESGARALFKLEDVLPSGRCELEVMTIRFSDRANELALKLQTAVATNQDWFLEHVKRAKPGEPLVYDRRLGLTKEEYAEYLRAGEKRYLAPTGDKLSCVFARNEDVLSLKIKDDDSPLNKIRLNTNTGELFASIGKVGKPTWRSSDDPKSPIGAYDACSWLYDKSDLDAFDARVVRLDIWRLRPSGKILWRFRDAEVVQKQSKQSFEIVFQYSPEKMEKGDGALGP